VEWSKLTLLFFNFLSQSLVWFHHPRSNLCNYMGKGYSICLHKALPEILHCVWKVPYRVQFLCVGQPAYTCTGGISKKWNTCLHKLLTSYNLGHSDFHINDLILGRLMPLEQGLPEIRACPWLLAWKGGTFFQECPASWSLAYTNIQRVLNRLVCRCEEKIVTGNEIAGLGSSWNLFS